MPSKPPSRAKQAIGYLGPEGTFSHLVALRQFGKSKELVACASFGAIFEMLDENPEACAVVPVENSSGGTIYDSIDLLIERRRWARVQEEITLDVRIALLGRKGQRIARVYSHFVPLQHHRAWLGENMAEAELVDAPSTSHAAFLAAAEEGSAALASPAIAELAGLDILRCPVIQGLVNVTHFYVVGRAAGKPSSSKLRKTALVAALKNRVGSLHAFLGPFARGGIDLKRIISRPIPGHPETYRFYIEIDGAAGEANIDTALRRAQRYCESLESVGSFPAWRRLAS